MRDAGDEIRSAFSFFVHRECEYYPCHGQDTTELNCLFCFCPMYYSICPGKPKYVQAANSLIKDCSGCDYPHRPENYRKVLEFLSDMNRQPA